MLRFVCRSALLQYRLCCIYDLSLRETEQNADGLYPEKVLLDRFKSAVNAYDSMAETYR